MMFAMWVIIMAFPAGVAVYTANFGVWLWRRRYRRGAVGVFLLAAASFAVPLALLIRTSPL